METLTELTIFSRQPEAQRYMLAQVRRLKFDDALAAQDWRLEYRCPESGEVHYLLVQSGVPVGLQYVKAKTWLNEVQIKLSHYLTVLGFTKSLTDFLEAGDGERVPDEYEHNRLPHLFTHDYWTDVDDDLDREDRLAYLIDRRGDLYANIKTLGSRAADVEDKISRLMAEQWLAKSNMRLKVGDRLLITDDFGSPPMTHVVEFRAFPPSTACMVVALRITESHDSVNGEVEDRYGNRCVLPLDTLLKMRTAYVAKFPNSNRFMNGG